LICIALYEETKNFVFAWPKMKRGGTVDEAEGYDEEEPQKIPQPRGNLHQPQNNKVGEVSEGADYPGVRVKHGPRKSL
jgi:hypothetical protein